MRDCIELFTGERKMCAKDQVQELLNAISAIYSDVYGASVDQVILYGSYARGDEKEDSDLDIVAIVHGNREQLQKDLYKVWEASGELELEYDTILSPTVIPYDEFQKYRNDLPYYRNIATEGVRVNAR